MTSGRSLARGCCCTLAVAAVLAVASQAQAQLKVSQLYGSGGLAGIPNGDFVEIFNASCAIVNLDDYSVQIASSTGTAWSVVNLPPFNLLPGQYYLIRLETTATGTPYTADLTASPAITPMVSTGGKVAIVLGNTALTVACPPASAVIDFFRYQATTAACTEGTVFFPNSTQASGRGYQRNGGGCVDTNNNLTDFTNDPGVAVPRNSSDPLNVCVPPLTPNYGACSNVPPTGTCVIMTEPECDTAAGVYAGDCTNCPLPGACCQPNGSCAIMQEAACTALGAGAVFAGDPTCPPAVGCAPAGACCLSDSTCVILNTTACSAASGNYQGDGSGCGEITYDATPSPVSGPGNFTDINATGTLVAGVSGTDDGTSAAINIGFTFNYFGQPFTSVRINNNGWLGFIAPVGTTYQNLDIPNATDPDGVVGALWDDLNSVTQGNVKSQLLGAPGSQVFIVQWTNVPQFNVTEPVGNTFQIKLYEGSDAIEFNYRSVTNENAGDTFPGTVVGVENNTGSAGTQAYGPMLNTRANLQAAMAAQPNGELMILFTPSGQTCPPPSGSCCVGPVCQVISQADCQEQFGFYGGNGTDCSPDPCTTEACCLPLGGCSDVLVVVCGTLGGVPQGPGSNCATASCPPAGRCCTATGGCSVGLEASCNAPGSSWTVGADCSTPCELGRCCQAGDVCSIVTQAGCQNLSGVWTAGDNCEGDLIFINPTSGPIPDGVTGPPAIPGVTTRVVTLPAVNVTDVVVRITFSPEHSWLGDLVATISSPDAITADLFARVNRLNQTPGGGTFGNSNDMNGTYRFGDAFSGNLWTVAAVGGDIPAGDYRASTNNNGGATTYPANGTFVDLDVVFAGQRPAGDWTLTVSDNAGGDTGSIASWALIINGGGSPCATAGCTCFGDMNGDSTVDGEDIAAFTACVTGGGGNCACADMDHSGGANANDVDEFVAALLAGSCGP